MVVIFSKTSLPNMGLTKKDRAFRCAGGHLLTNYSTVLLCRAPLQQNIFTMFAGVLMSLAVHEM